MHICSKIKSLVGVLGRIILYICDRNPNFNRAINWKFITLKSLVLITFILGFPSILPTSQKQKEVKVNKLHNTHIWLFLWEFLVNQWTKFFFWKQITPKKLLKIWFGFDHSKFWDRDRKKEL